MEHGQGNQAGGTPPRSRHGETDISLSEREGLIWPIFERSARRATGRWNRWIFAELRLSTHLNSIPGALGFK